MPVAPFLNPLSYVIDISLVFWLLSGMELLPMWPISIKIKQVCNFHMR
jgi:hypothetical protein